MLKVRIKSEEETHHEHAAVRTNRDDRFSASTSSPSLCRRPSVISDALTQFHSVPLQHHPQPTKRCEMFCAFVLENGEHRLRFDNAASTCNPPPPSPFQAAAKSLREQPSAGLEGGRTALQITEPNAQQLSKAPLKASGQKVVPVFVSDENAI